MENQIESQVGGDFKPQTTFQEQKKEQTEAMIKKLVIIAKNIDLDIVQEIADENDSSYFFDLSGQQEKVGQSLDAIKTFCTVIRNIK